MRMPARFRRMRIVHVRADDQRLIHDARTWLAGASLAVSATIGAFFLLGKAGVFEYDRRLTVIETKLESLSSKVKEQGDITDRGIDRLDKKMDYLLGTLIQERRK